MAILHRTWIALIALSIVVVLSHVWGQRFTVHKQRATPFPSPRTTTSVLDVGPPVFPQRDEDWAEPRVDLNGNELDVAVGDYRVDTHGEMYERHAPDTALIHLSSPEL